MPTRSSTTIAGAVLAGAMLIVAGCTRAPTCAGAGCGTAVIAEPGDVNVIFPPLTQSSTEIAVSDLIFLKLADIGPSLNTVGDSGFVPRLADRWHFADSLTLVFHLNPKAVWEDGAPVTAQDVAFTFDVYRDTTLNVWSRPLLNGIASVTARDSADVAFRFTHRYPQQFYDATYQMRILPKHLLDTIPRARLSDAPFLRRPVGDGPYHLVRWVPGQTIDLAATPNFFLGRPGLARLIWRMTPDYNTALTQLVTGTADILELVLGPERIAQAQKAPDVQLVPYPSNAYTYLVFNLRDPHHLDRPNPLFHNRALRQAITLGIDRHAIIQALLGGQGQIPTGPTAPMVAIWNDSLQQLPFDSARARRMLDSLGWHGTKGGGIRERSGRRLAFDLEVPSSSSVRRQAAVIVQNQLRALGVAVRIRVVEFNTMVAHGNAGTFDVIFGGVSGIDPRPSAMLQYWGTASIGGDNYGGYSDPRFDSLVAAASAATDRAVVRRLWNEAIATINNDAPAVWMFTPAMFAGVNRRFEHVRIPPEQWTALLWQWTVPPDKMIERDRIGVP